MGRAAGQERGEEKGRKRSTGEGTWREDRGGGGKKDPQLQSMDEKAAMKPLTLHATFKN